MNIIPTTSAPCTPGIYSGLSNEAYHAGPGVSKSQLDVLARSPYHYYCQYVSAFPIERAAPTASMRFGTLVHTAILEPDVFAKHVVMPDVDGRTKEGKAAKLAAIEEAMARGVEAVDAESYDKASTIARSFARHDHLARYLADGHPELSVYWKDEDTGLLCRCRPDWLSLSQECVVDLKTTEDAGYLSFQRSIHKWRYYVQAAFYLDGLAANGLDGYGFVFAAIERNAPHACAGYVCTESMIDAGRQEYRRLLALLKDCHDENEWPGYQRNIEGIGLPPYASPMVNLEDDDVDNAFALSNEPL
jgi:hypothetical protein